MSLCNIGNHRRFRFLRKTSETILTNVVDTKTADAVTDSKITGLVKDFKNDCLADGVCNLQVNNKRRMPLGGGTVESGSEAKIKGDVKDMQFDELKSSLVKKVEIFGRVFATSTITLEANASYYVHVIKAD